MVSEIFEDVKLAFDVVRAEIVRNHGSPQWYVIVHFEHKLS